jgi:hypothetical protein
MSDEIENRLRVAGLELRPPSPETEERALLAALAALPELGTPTGAAGRKGLRRFRGRLGLPRRRLVLLAATTLPLIVVGVVAWTLVSTGSSSPSVIVGGAGASSDRFPSETFTDWVSYSDQVSVFSVVSEEEVWPSPQDLKRDLEQGTGYLGRVVTLRIERTIWRREDAPSAEDTIRVFTWGWALNEDGERRASTAPWGGPRLEVGARYVAPLVRAPRNGVQWTPLSDGATLPLDGDLITTTGIGGNPSPIAERMEGRSVDALAEILAGTPPDPIAAKYFDLGPDARWQAVLREGGPTD